MTAAAVLLGIIFAAIVAVFPMVGLSFAAIFELWFSYIKIYLFPPRNYVVICLFLALLLSFMLPENRKLSLNSEIKKFYAVTVLYILCAVIVNAVNRMDTVELVNYTAARLIIPVFISFCIIYFVKTRARLSYFMIVMIAGIAASSFVGIMQYFGIGDFWDLRFKIGELGAEEELWAAQDIVMNRIRGLAYFAIPLATQMALGLPLMASILISLRMSLFSRIALLLATGCVLTGLILTLTRSAIIGGAAGLIIVLALSRIRAKYYLWLMAGVAVASVSLAPTDIFDRFSLQEESAQARIPLAVSAVKMAVAYPFGLGTGQYEERSMEFYADVSHMRGAGIISTTGTHNQFLNVLVAYGFPGLLLNLYLHFLIFKMIWQVTRCTDSYLRTLGNGLLGSFAAYVINSLFHNAGPFYSDVFVWYFIGIVFVVHNFTVQEPPLR